MAALGSLFGGFGSSIGSLFGRIPTFFRSLGLGGSSQLKDSIPLSLTGPLGIEGGGVGLTDANPLLGPLAITNPESLNLGLAGVNPLAPATLDDVGDVRVDPASSLAEESIVGGLPDRLEERRKIGDRVENVLAAGKLLKAQGAQGNRQQQRQPLPSPGVAPAGRNRQVNIVNPSRTPGQAKRRTGLRGLL